LHISRRMERAILYVLAVEDHPLSRSSLIDLLWPKAEQIDPRSALRTALSRLRSELPDPDLLVTELDQVWLDQDHVIVDVLEFEAKYHKLQTLLAAHQESRPLPSGIVQQVDTALAMWNGDAVIEGENLTTYSEIESWRLTLDRRMGYHRQHLLKRLAQHFRASGLLDEALDIFSQLAESNILDVTFHLAIINILADLGRHHDVITYCDDLERVFETNFNSPLPDPILERCQFSRIQVDANIASSHSDWPAPLTMQLRLADRQTELEQLHQAFFIGGLAVLKGELGTGKTRLVQECFQTLSPKPKLFYAPCREMEVSLPLSSLIHSLRRDIPPEIWSQLDDHWLKNLCVLLPELSTFCEEFEPIHQANFPSGEQNLFDAIHQVLLLTAEKTRRLLFVLDDAQWADHYTLRALDYLIAESFFDQHGLLVLVFRSEEQNHHLDDFIDRYHRTRQATTLSLTGLDQESLSSLAEQVLGDPPPMFLIEKLYEKTNGNPFVTLEIIRELQNSSDSIGDFGPSSSLPLPASVYAVFNKRLSHLDDLSRSILLTGAVLGNDFSMRTLQDLSELAQEKLISNMDNLVEKGFLTFSRQEETGKTNLQFTHEIIREVILKESSPIQLQHLHQQTAVHLSQSPHTNAAVIANHFLSGMDIHKAFEWLLKAADYAWTLGARDEVLRNLEKAESLVRNTPESDFGQDEIQQLYMQWIDFAYQSNQIAMLENLGVKLQYLGERESDPLLLGISQVALSNACFLRNDFETGFELIQQALTNLYQTDHPLPLCQALFRQGALSWWLLDFQKSLDSYHQVQEIIKQQTPSLKFKALAFSAQYMAGTVYGALGDANKTVQIAQHLINDYKYLSLFDLIRAKNLYAMGSLLSADFNESISAAKDALEITNVLDNTFVEEVLLLTLSRAEIFLGYLDESYDHAQRAIELAEKSHHIDAVINGNSILGDIYFRLQNFSKASQHYQLARMRQGVTRLSQHGLENDVLFAYLLAWTGQTAQAKALLELPLKISNETGMQQLFAQSLLVSGVVDVVSNSFDNAGEKFKTAEEISLENNLREDLLWCWVAQSRLLISKHQLTEAESLLKRIIIESQKIGSVWTLLYSVQLDVQLQKVQDDEKERAFIEEAFHSMMSILEAHTHSDALQHDFLLAQKSWSEGHHYP
jgi:DNA-binding SARP family transcriptional activator/tetratricopeptide (TPR) repeat protein